MKPVTIVVLVVAVLVAGYSVYPQLREFTADVRRAQSDTGDVMASATYQRFAARRNAVAAMRAALGNFAVAQSLFVADSGYPASVFFPGRYAFASDKSNIGPTIEIRQDRWVARMNNIHTSIECTITALLDTASGRYHAGEPVCAGWTPQESLAIAVDTVSAHR